MTAANVVTTLRLLVAIPFAVLVFVQIHYAVLTNAWGLFGAFVPAVLFILISLLDNLDGYLARSRNEVSNYGKLMDPIADKVLIGSLLVVFCTQYSFVFVPYTILVLFREVGITIFRSVYAKKYGIVISAGLLGKIKTVVQTVAISAWLLQFSIFQWTHIRTLDDIWSYIISLLFIIFAFVIALILTYASGIIYIMEAQQLKPTHPSDEL